MSMAQLERLQESLTQIFRRDPVSHPVVSVSFTLPNALAFLSIDGGTLAIRTEEESAGAALFDSVIRDRETTVSNIINRNVGVILPLASFTIDLRDWTLERLVEYLNAHPGFTASILDTRYAKILAAAICTQLDDYDLGLPSVLSVDTNPLSVLLKPIAFAIDRHELNIDKALAQLNLLTSEKFFADYWGTFMGIMRLPGESDATYTQRIVDEILLKRDNNVSLEALIADAYGVRATVSDLLPLVLNINNAICFSKIPGEVYNVGSFLITAPLTGDDLRSLVDRHRAAGTRAFFKRIAEAGFIDIDPTITITWFDLSLFDASLIPEQELGVFASVGNIITEFDTGLPEWTVGLMPMPGTQIA